MQPQLRDWYLSTMGVVQYRLRGASGASPKHVSAEPGVTREKTSIRDALQGPGATSHHEHGAGGAATLKSLLAGDDKAANGLPEASASAREIPAEKDRDQAEASVAFRLACWRPSEDLLVIDSWPRDPGLESQRLQLLANVLKSIQRKPDQLPAPEFIDWPIGGDASLPAAGAYVTMFVQGRYQQAPFKRLLAMGEDAARCLGRTTGTSAITPPELINGVEVIYTHSLSEMIERPSCKREVWQAIRFLSA